MNYNNQFDRIKHDLDIYIENIDKLYDEKDAVFLLKEYYIKPVNGQAVRINGLQVNEGSFRAWYAFTKLITSAVTSGKFQKEIIRINVKGFQDHIQRLILSDDRPNPSAYFENMQKQLAINGYINMTLDKNFTSMLFNTNMLLMMAEILFIPEEFRIKMGNYLLDNYVNKKYSDRYRNILIP